MEAISLTVGEASIEKYGMLEARKTLWCWTAIGGISVNLRFYR